MEFTIRSYRPADLLALWKLDQSCFPPGVSYTSFELKTYIHRPGAFTLVAEATAAHPPSAPSGGQDAELGHVLGFVVAHVNLRKTGHVITIDVRSEARRQRVGSALLADAERQLRLRNCSRVRLETAVDNIAALSFYKRHGYCVTQSIPRYYSNGVDALLLEKDLLSPLASK